MLIDVNAYSCLNSISHSFDWSIFDSCYYCLCSTELSLEC